MTEPEAPDETGPETESEPVEPDPSEDDAPMPPRKPHRVPVTT